MGRGLRLGVDPIDGAALLDVVEGKR